MPRVLDSLSADLVFAWRQLNKRRGVTAVVVLSLGLPMGAATAAFRLIDGLILRTLPVAEPDRLFATANTREDATDNLLDYPTYRRYRDAVGDRGDVLLVGMVGRPV